MVMKKAKNQKAPRTPLPAPALPPSDHPYMRVISGDFRPSRGSSQAWALAKPIAAQLLLADYAKRDANEDKRAALARTSALCLYLTWIAENVPEHLIDDPMDHDEIRRYLATDGQVRRNSHRSRVALGAILKSIGPDAKARIVLGKVSTIAPTDDQLFEKALQVVGNFRNPETRANSRSLLLLARSTGATGHDLRYITGSDVVKRAQAGTWVVIGTPGNERDVPVLKRFQKDLEDLALSAGASPMVSRSGTVPIDSSKPGEVAGVISRELKRSKIPGLIQVVGLRKAWIAEQVASNAPLLTLLKAAGVKSLRSFDDLLAEHAPLPSTNDQHISYELGGTE
jgi:hypothetical protein